MSLLPWLPWQTHPGASCDRRERNSAIAAIASCFVLALGLVIAAIMFAARLTYLLCEDWPLLEIVVSRVSREKRGKK